METASSVVPISTRKTYESPQPQVDGRTSEDIVREWIARFAVNCGQELSEARVMLWIDELSAIDPERLELAFQRVMRAHTFNSIPQIGEIHAQLSQADAKGFELEAEEAWQFSLDYCTRHFHPDLGVDRGAPELPVACDHAIRASGGMSFIFNATREELVWVKKRFIEDYTTIHETRQVEHLLSRVEARKILTRLAGNLQSQRALPQPTGASSSAKEVSDAEITEATEAARRKIFGQSVQTKNEPDYTAAIRQQKETLVARGFL